MNPLTDFELCHPLSVVRTSSGYVVNNTTIVLLYIISSSKGYMFRSVVAIIRSLSFDILKIILYNCAAACLMRRSSTHNDAQRWTKKHTISQAHTRIVRVHSGLPTTGPLRSLPFCLVFFVFFSYSSSLFFGFDFYIIDLYLYVLLRGSPTHLI